MNPTNKPLYAFMAFGPAALGVIATMLLMVAIIDDPNSRDMPPLAMVGLLLWIPALLLSIVGFIMYLVHMARNRRLDDGNRIGWIVGMVAGFLLCTMLMPWILSIVYYFLHIANEKPYVAPNQSFGGSTEWDSKLNS